MIRPSGRYASVILLIGFGARNLDDLAPFFDLGFDIGKRLFRRGVAGFHPLTVPTARMIVRASTNSTREARKDARTEGQA